MAEVCRRCRGGKHDHDRHTGKVPGSTPGADAGCPYAVTGGDQCACTLVVDRDGAPVAQKVGPGDPPSPRDEPVAFAIWQSLLRVRDAWGWDDVARHVEEDLRARGLVGDVHDRLRAAERDLAAEQATSRALRAQWRAKHVKEFPTVADEVHGTNPECSCGRAWPCELRR